MSKPPTSRDRIKPCARKGCAKLALWLCTYCSRACVNKAQAEAMTPEQRQARAKKAGEAARLSHLRRSYERAGHLHPMDAWKVGYKTGYARAYHYWKQRMAAQQKGRRAA